LIRAGVIRSVQIQGSMPGLRWTVEGFSTFSTRSYTTAEAEGFTTGALAAMERRMIDTPFGPVKADTIATDATRNRPLSSERETVEERLARLAHLIDSPAFALTEDDVRYDYATGRHRYA